jgi:uncharacterized Zn finger protein
VPVAERRRRAATLIARFRKTGKTLSPIQVEGRTIARTFWGEAWCRNLERYSDYANRLPRGRTYLRNGSVLDLRIGPREVRALVSGSSLYKVIVRVSPVSPARWRAICRDCAGAVDSLVELLQGRFSTGVMERICRERTGLFPTPSEIKLSCSCPDWATMCKHVAAVFYGIGARVDERPELFFTLRAVDQNDLIARAGRGLALAKKAPARRRVLERGNLAEIFGLEMAPGGGVGAGQGTKSRPRGFRFPRGRD